MRLRASWLFIILLACAALVAPWQERLCAQEPRGTITGKVMDPSKAVIPGATVRITNVAMGTTRTVVTNDSGVYTAPYLLPGTYKIEVEVSGFKKFVRDGIQLRVQDLLDIDINLEVGELAEVVTVSGETPLLTSSTASMGSLVDSRRVSELPTPHGEPYALIGLAAGVSYSGSATLNRPFEPTHIVGYAFAGTRANRSDVTIDGLPSTATANANEVISSYVPPADIVQEFKVQTATYDASFGQTEGGVTNISIKSGTNALHGTGYWANQAASLAANEWFSNATGKARADWDYNRWGASVNGPVYFGGLYDGRNKTFFLWGYEGIHESRPRNNNGSPSVPTAAMKKGDFSSLLAVSPNYQIYNPWTAVAAAGGRVQRQAFDKNIIPDNLINPIAKKVLNDYYPEPVSAGDAVGQNNMLEPNLPEVITYYTHTIRVDHNLTDKQRVFVRGSFYKRESNYNNYLHSIASGEWFQFLSRQGVIDYVYTLNSTTVVNARYGYNRFVRVTDANPGQRGMDISTLGFPKAYNDSISQDIRRFTRFDITSYTGTGIGGEWRPCDTHAFSFTMNKMMGVHALKGGMEFRAYRENDSFFANEQTGRFVFDAAWTRGPLDTSATAPGSVGQSIAAFLLGLPTSGYVRRAASYAEQSPNWGFFIHDDWRVNNKLSLNIGLRIEHESPLTERFDRSVTGFDFPYVQPFEAQAKAAYALNPTPEVPVDQFKVRGGLLFANVGGLPRGLYNTPTMNLMPRFGLAYKLTEKFVMRGGYGIFFGFLGERRGDVIQSGFTRDTQFIASLDNGLTFVNTLSNPFPTGILEPLGAAQAQQTFVGQAVTFFNQDPKIPYMQRWQLGFQYELPSGFVADLSYVGNRGTHVEIARNLNATPNQYLSTSPARDQTRINYLGAQIPNPFYGLMPAGSIAALSGKTIARERLLRAHPEFDTVNGTTNNGYSWYHSLQAGLQKRFAQGYTFGLNYTFSKFMAADTYLNAGDPLPTKMISDQDAPHRLAMSGIYELPFGQGRRFGSDVHPVVSKIIGGWQIQGIYQYQTARISANWGNIIFYGNLKDVPSDNPTVERWFNTDAGFEKDSKKALASNVRTFPQRFNGIRPDPVSNIDLSVTKKTAITEGKEVQFRAEFVNAANHANFAAPNLDPTSASFGRVTAAINYSRRIQLGLKFVF
jgi:hypothetical protein